MHMSRLNTQNMSALLTNVEAFYQHIALKISYLQHKPKIQTCRRLSVFPCLVIFFYLFMGWRHRRYIAKSVKCVVESVTLI